MLGLSCCETFRDWTLFQKQDTCTHTRIWGWGPKPEFLHKPFAFTTVKNLFWGANFPFVWKQKSRFRQSLPGSLCPVDILKHHQKGGQNVGTRAVGWRIYIYIDIYRYRYMHAYGYVIEPHFRQLKGASSFLALRKDFKSTGFRALRGARGRQNISQVRMKGCWVFCRLGCFGCSSGVVLTTLFL